MEVKVYTALIRSGYW